MTNDDICHNKCMLIVASRPRKLKQPTRFARLSPPQDKIPPPFRLTPRILSILAALASHRFLSTDQIARLDGGSRRSIERLLRVLHRHGFVDRPAAQAAYLSSFVHDGNFSLAHNINRKGMRILAENGSPVDPRLDWTTKNTGHSALFLAHALQVSAVMLDFRLALPIDGSLRLVDAPDMLPAFPEQTRKSQFPYRVPVTIVQDRKPLTVSVVPDRLFSLIGADQQRWNFCLEVDRGTESLSARSKKISTKSTFRKKIAGYYSCWHNRKHEEVWGLQKFRVLTVTTSETRIENMIMLQREVTDDHAGGLFLYTTSERITQHGVLGPAWRSSKEDSIALVRT